MDFITFNDFLNCVYVPPTEANQRPSPDEVLEGLLMMYSGEAPDITTPNENIARKTVQGLKVIGAGVVKIVHKCKDARESSILDLNSCTLLHVPDGVLYLMKHYDVVKCDLSNNLLSRMSPKFGSCFSNITSLNLSMNQISSLPKEIALCKKLEKISISSNCLVVFPYILLEIEELRNVDISKNYIADIDEEAIEGQINLEEINLEENPLSEATHRNMSKIVKMKILLSERIYEEWEDLTI